MGSFQSSATYLSFGPLTFIFLGIDLIAFQPLDFIQSAQPVT